ncbi:MAG: hypothetical protein H8D56_09585 [Planctomycetes bacterium]|nr:hypothetical protein [Planctomycetota bacterium]MBL7146807.1 hypothetical protein [Phycisphaerae bacterium]
MMKWKVPFIYLILVSGLTFVITFFAVARFAASEHTRREKRANISEIADLLRIAEPLHTGDYDEAKRKLCGLLLRHAWNIGKLKGRSNFGEREAANRSLASIGSFYESNGGYLDSYFTVDAPRYIEEARKELNE